MDAETMGKLRRLRLEQAKIERQIDELLGLNSGPRKPIRETLTRDQLKALFADARRSHRERSTA